MDFTRLQIDFFRQLSEPYTCEGLFDHLTDIVYFVKNSQGQYIAINQTMVNRCGFKDKSEIIGKRPDEIHPEPLGTQYRLQDEQVLKEGKPIHNQLELHISPTLDLCWCLTTKVPLRNSTGEIIGISGISRDLQQHNEKNKDFGGIADTVSYIKKNYNQALLIDDLAAMASMSTYQYEQRMQKIFKLTAGQFIQKTRIEVAVWKLRESELSIANIAMDCGYADQSAFSRQFKKTIGISPAQYRRISGKNGD